VERNRATQPLALAGPEFRDPRTYSLMTYNKGAAVLRMLREMLGEETFRRGTRLYFDRHRLKHVTPADFQRAMEDASGRRLDWFFAQWIERTDRLDYGIARVASAPAGGGRWRTTVEVLRSGEAWMPVRLQVGDATRTLDSRERRQTVTVVTSAKPAEVALDPGRVLLDMDRSNDRAPVP
jgi:aminopeptidase N